MQILKVKGSIDSDQIFNAIPPLKDPTLEAKRKDIVNYCFSLDTK